MCEDYAFMISGLLDLYQATFDSKYLSWARILQDTQIKTFWDNECGGFYSVSEDNSNLIFRPKNAFDASEPSANGISATNLLRLWSILKDNDYKNKAIDVLECYKEDIKAQPFGYCSMMEAVHMYNSGLKSIVVVAGPDKEGQRFDALGKLIHMNATVVQLDSKSMDYLKDFGDNFYSHLFNARKSGWNLYLCDDQACRPINSLEDIMIALKN
jgi:uncharacterized protein YyaL (SSP411 family)